MTQATKLPTLYGPGGETLPAGIGAHVRAAASMGYGGGAWRDSVYAGGSMSSAELGGWAAMLTAADGVTAGERDTITARARELVRDNALAKTAIKRRVGMVVGAGWIMSPNVDHEALGITPEQGRALGAQLARNFRTWAKDPLKRCHTQRLWNFDQMLRLAARERLMSGAAIGVLRWSPDLRWTYSTQLQLVDPDRLSNPNALPDSMSLRDGIELDHRGAPVAFHFRDAHPNDTVPDAPRWKWTRVPRWDEATGRPVTLYSFDPERAEATHGVSAFAAILKDFKQVGRYTDAELGKAIVQTLYVAFIKSGMPPDKVLEHLKIYDSGSNAVKWTDAQAAYYQRSGGLPRLFEGGPRLTMLHPGDEMEFTASTAGPSAFNDFVGFFTRGMAAALGLFHPQLTEDWAGINFSSARAGLNEIWRDVTVERSDLAVDFADPVYLALAEESIRWGYVVEPPGAPSFYENPYAYCRCTWIGPGRGHVDPDKEASADETNLANGFTTLATIAAERGMALEDLLAQLKHEIELRKLAGLPPLEARPPRPQITFNGPGQ